eukprot:TRINITY_DN13151_c0_g1_i1.p1 TRINITY_DN13151_c0_g1~~TRINITY_DN13151_c0_g1_i1.p1  ORF type:complete len:111 (-),score=11.69 TRINITY_DN13151_c0_g1_i1:145-477(-)
MSTLGSLLDLENPMGESQFRLSIVTLSYTLLLEAQHVQALFLLKPPLRCLCEAFGRLKDCLTTSRKSGFVLVGFPTLEQVQMAAPDPNPAVTAFCRTQRRVNSLFEIDAE